MKWLFLMIAIAAEVTATSALKSSEGFTKLIPSAVVLAGYTISFYFLSLTLKSLPLSIAYAVWCGIGIILVSLIGIVLFKQSLDIPGIIGISLIICGVLVINLFSSTVSH